MTSMESERETLATKWILQHFRNQTIEFNEDALEIYGKLLCHVAGADGVLAPAERDWIIGHRAASGASAKILDMLKTYEPSHDDWKTELQKNRPFIECAKYNIIYDSFQAASADNELHEKEREAISDLAQEIGVDKETVKQIAQLYQDEAEIKKRRLALLFPTGVDECIRKAQAFEKP